jgi:AraC family transcriptional regulator, transcriptional activator FtrA
MTRGVDFPPPVWHADGVLTNVAVAVLPRVAPFELGTICEVFGMDRTEMGVPAFDFAICAERPGEPLPTKAGFSITAPHGFDRLAEADLVAVPASGGRDYPEALLQALRDAVDRGAWVLSVCSGAEVLAASGILDGRRCTTHWMHAADLAARHPAVTVELDVLYVEDGTILTSAGTAAGIDACLHLVRRELGSEVAATIARRMVVPPQREGGQRQYVESPVPHVGADTLQPVLEWALEHLDQDLSVAALARRAMMSERTFARRFRAETGSTPYHWVTGQRVLLARRMLESTTASVEQVAARCGLGTAAILRHHFTRVVGTSPQAYRRSFCTIPA